MLPLSVDSIIRFILASCFLKCPGVSGELSYSSFDIKLERWKMKSL